MTHATNCIVLTRTNMASKENIIASRDILECSMCKEAFKTSKCLPCIHTFCLECLEQYGKDEKPRGKMPCPLCRQMFKIPAEGFKKLPNNIFIEQILSSIRLLQSASQNKEPKCQLCNETESNKYCVECAQSICDRCSVIHGNATATRTHKVVDLQEMEESQVYLRSRPVNCDTHKEEQLKLYCYDCSKAICLLCSTVEHRSHH